ncbi:MAG: hypothetical protein Q4A92_11750 [Corynebacterium sp.]|nr:hypothetical protein [Corynebacterium sp.]
MKFPSAAVSIVSLLCVAIAPSVMDATTSTASPPRLEPLVLSPPGDDWQIPVIDQSSDQPYQCYRSATSSATTDWQCRNGSKLKAFNLSDIEHLEDSVFSKKIRNLAKDFRRETDDYQAHANAHAVWLSTNTKPHPIPVVVAVKGTGTHEGDAVIVIDQTQHESFTAETPLTSLIADYSGDSEIKVHQIGS